MMSYNEIIKASRSEELLIKRSSLEDVVDLLEQLSESLTNAINNAAIDGTLRKDQLEQMKRRVEHDLDMFETAYRQIVTKSTNDSAQLILNRNGELMVEAEGKRTVIDLIQDRVLNEVFNIAGRDGLILSDRIWRISQEAKRDITNRVVQGILLGESHTKVARDIRQFVNGTGGLRYKSERLVLTEFARAYKVANEMSVEVMREESQFMWYEKWELSPAHKEVDVCDVLAAANPEGEGPGVYKKAPNRHPGCYCYIFPVYREKRKTGKDYGNISGVQPNVSEATPHDHKLAKQLSM